MNSNRRKAVDLDKGLTELEGIVEQLESGDLPLERSLKEFERGVRLSRECQGALKDAEQRVQILLDGDLREFDRADERPSGGDEDPHSEAD